MLKINKNSKFIRPKFNWEKEYMPKPGMLGTEYVGSDRYSVVCISVDSPKRITVVRLWGLDESNIENNSDIQVDGEGVMWIDEIFWKDDDKYNASKPEKWSLRQNGKWKEMGNNSSSIHWGIANPYRDPNF